MKMPEPVGQQGRWLDLLGEYDITIQHRPGRVHGNSDALSRRPCEQNFETDCKQCTKATSTIAAVPVSCEALSTDRFTALPTPLRFPPRHTQVERSQDSILSMGLTDNVSDFLEAPIFPVSPSDATSASPTNGAPVRTHVCGVTGEPISLSLEDIGDAQTADDSFRPVIQALMDRVKPPQENLRDYPEEARILFAQWDSLVLENNVLYRRYHYPDGTTKYLQVVLPAKLRRPYIEHMHADLGHFGRTKTCLALVCRAYFPGALTGLIVRNCATCSMHQRSHLKPTQANLKPMREFRPMSVVHADLVGPLHEGKNSRNQRGFQNILSVVDSATQYLWLLPIRHKTAECVAATLFDEVISRVSVPSSILTDQGGEFTGEVVECLLKRLGITHLRTSVYHPQTDAKCERAHFSVHNMITKMITDKHDRWPDLGSVALGYNATLHTSTGYSLHELFYSFAPSCPLDAIMSTPASDPASNADEFALQTFERLQEATAFVLDFTGGNIQRMKRRYDATVRPQSYAIGEKVLVYNPKKRRGQFAKWQSCWTGPYVIENVLNQTNYVVKKGRDKDAVIHVDRMRKLPNELSSDNSDSKEDDMHSASQPKLRRKASDAAMETSTHCTMTTNCTDTDTGTPLFSPMDTCLMHACQSALTFAIRRWMKAKVDIERAWRPLNLSPLGISHTLR